MKTKKILAISSGLLALGLAGVAQADIRATALIDVTNFTINRVVAGAAGPQLINGTDVNVISFTNTSDQDVTLGAATASQTNPGSTTSVDFAPDCVGACPAIVDNAFPVLSGTTASNFAAADQRDNGSPIIGLAGFAQTTTDVGSGSYVSIDTGSVAASANSNNNLNASFDFTLAQATALAFVFDVRSYLEAFVTSDETAPSFATASTNFNFTIRDVLANVDVFSLDPAVLNQTVSLNAPLPIDLLNSGTHANGVATTLLGFQAITPLLSANTLYQLSARINTNTDGSRVVPEPSSIALLGMGLLGFAAKFRRRKAV